MKNGDLYQHYKGGKYIFKGIALPVEDDFVNKRNLVSFGRATYHENTHELELFSCSSKDYNTKKVWAREVDDFFGFIQSEERYVKRFALNGSTK